MAVVGQTLISELPNNNLCHMRACVYRSLIGENILYARKPDADTESTTNWTNWFGVFKRGQ